MVFERCTVKVDKNRQVCLFEGSRGIGIAGKLDGVLAVERDGQKESFDLGAFAAKHVPHPELIVRFNSRKVRTAGTSTLAAVVQLLDRAGTDLGQFNVPVGDFEYTIKAHGANVYRFEVSQRNTAVVRMACDGAAGALQADQDVRFFGGANEVLNFCVPACAELVLVDVTPHERVQAELIDATGKVVASMPYQNLNAVFEVKRQKTQSDEVWKLRFIKIEEDMAFKIGGDAIPLASPVASGVIGRKPAKKK